MEVKVFRPKRDNDYKSIQAQCNLKRNMKSDPSRRNKRKYIFVPAAWATQAWRRQGWNLPSTVHNISAIWPQPCLGHASATTRPSLPARIYRDTRSCISLWSLRNASISKCQWDGWITWPLSARIAQVQRGGWAPMFPVQSLQKETRPVLHDIASKLPLQSRIFIFNYYTLECFI